MFKNLQPPKRETWQSITSGLAPRFKAQFAEIQNYYRILEQGSMAGIISVSDNSNGQATQLFREKEVGYVETSFFDTFSFLILQGDKNCLKETNSMSISETKAQKYFKNTNPIGKMLTMNNQFGKTVYKDFPPTSDLQYDMLFSLETLKNPANLNGNGWMGN